MKILKNKIRKSAKNTTSLTDSEKVKVMKAVQTLIEQSSSFRCGHIAIQNEGPMELFVYSIDYEGDIRNTFYATDIIAMVNNFDAVSSYIDVSFGNPFLRIYI